MTSPLDISPRVEDKISKKVPPVSAKEIEQCLDNCDGIWLEDDRPNNKTVPPTHWFIAETNRGRKLKVCLIHLEDEDRLVIKTAYDPNQDELDIYRDYGYP